MGNMIINQAIWWYPAFKHTLHCITHLCFEKIHALALYSQGGTPTYKIVDTSCLTFVGKLSLQTSSRSHWLNSFCRMKRTAASWLQLLNKPTSVISPWARICDLQDRWKIRVLWSFKLPVHFLWLFKSAEDSSHVFFYACVPVTTTSSVP